MGSTQSSSLLLFVYIIICAFVLGVLFDNSVVSHRNRSSLKSTVAIVTVATADLQLKYQQQLKSIQDYAKRHGYTYSEYSSSYQPGAYWDKLAALSEIKRHDLYLFFDADSAILKPSIRAEELFRERDSVIFSGSPTFSSSHFVGLRDDEVSKAFLRAWSRGRGAREACHYDQGAFLYAMVGTVQRYVYGNEHNETRTGLSKCAQMLHDHKDRCRMFQTCLSRWMQSWFCGYTNHCCVSQSNENSAPEFRKRAEQVPFRWQCDMDFIVSWQGTKRNIYEGDEVCSSFSLHPVKDWERQMSKLRC